MGILDLVFPERCAACGGLGTPFCASCLAALPRLGGPLCDRCGAPTAWPVSRCRECSGRRLAFASARAAVGYDRAAAALVASWKEHGIRKLAPVAADLVADTLLRPAVQALSFVPPDGDRSIRRGHHPAQRLALELGVRWDLPVESLVARKRKVERQRGLSVAARRANVAGAFRPRWRRRAPLRVVLVDDVYTTGATASAAASALRAGGAREVHVITFARAVRGS